LGQEGATMMQTYTFHIVIERPVEDVLLAYSTGHITLAMIDEIIFDEVKEAIGFFFVMMKSTITHEVPPCYI
jgi:hypothetical protein